MTIRIAPTPATLGAVITGVKLAAPSEAEWRATLAGFHEHRVLIFSAQHLSHDEQAAFARRFGEIEHIVADRDTVARA